MSNKTKNAQPTSSSKTKKDASKVASKNLQVSAEKIKASPDLDRVLKYTYPANCTTQDQKKEFRRKARQTERRFNKQLQALNESTERGTKSQAKELQGKYKEFQAATYTSAN